MSKKMCPNHKTGEVCEFALLLNWCGEDMTNSKCEIIIPKKPKPARVKAWALKSNPRYCAPLKYENFCVPCHVVFDRKHLKGRKG